MGYRLGVDVGGTFTDLLCITPDGDVVVDKTPTTPDDQSTGVMNGVAQLAERFGLSVSELCAQLDILVHGTTTADNTMIEMNGAPTGLLVTEGHRDEIEMRRVHKEEIWDPSYPAPPPIARRRARIPIPERLDFRGEVRLPLDEEAVRRGVQRLRALGVRSVAIMFLFSFVNPAHERRAAEIVREEFPDVEHISLSHEVMARGPEFERVSTTLVNAYVAPRIANYVTSLQSKLRHAGYGGSLLIMQATGGVMPPEYVARRAVSLLASGPTGGVMGATLAAAQRRGARLRRRRHGRHQLRRVPGAGWPPGDQDRLELAVPLLPRPADGRRPERRRRRRIDRPGPAGRAARRPESAGSVPGPGLLRPRGGSARPSPTPTWCSATCPTRRVRRRAHAARRRRGANGDQPRSSAVPLGDRRRRRRVGGGAHRQRQHGQRDPAGARVARRRPADALQMIAYGGNGAVHAWAIARELGIERCPGPEDRPRLLGARGARRRLRRRPRARRTWCRCPRSTSTGSGP